MKLLHIIATPRIHSSNTLRISNAFLEGLYARYDDLNVESLDLFDIDLPSVTGDNIEAKYTLISGAIIDKRHEESWKQIESFIEHFQNADMYLLSTPMWNFGVPYALKYYIDAIVQPNYLFRYNELGQPEGMIKGKKMVCITTRGGDYSENTPFHAYDFLEPHLRAVFGWIGITDMLFINAQPMDITREIRQAAIVDVIAKARKLAAETDWRSDKGDVDTGSPKGLKPAPLE